MIDVSLWSSQFIALMKKNLLLKRRNKRMTIMEIVYPLYWLLILVMLQSTLPVDTAIPEIDGFSSVPLLPFTTKCVTSGDSLLRVCQIAYAPDDSEVVRSTMRRLGDIVRLIPFANEDDIQQYYVDNPGQLWAAVVWNEGSVDANEKKNDIYSKTINFNDVSFTLQMNQTQLYQNSNGELISSGFISLQNSIQQAIINEKLSQLGLNKTVSLQTSTQLYPQRYMPLGDRIYDILWAIMFPMIFSYVLQCLTSSIVTEKKEKLKEGMKMMGLKESVYWLSWLSIQLLVNLFLTIVFVVCSYIFGLFHYTPYFITFTSFYLYSSSIVGMAFFVSVFFGNPKTASSVGFLFFFSQVLLSGVIQYFLFPKEELWSICLIYVASVILPPLPLAHLAIYMAEAEYSHQALSLFAASPTFYPVYMALGFLFVNIIVYCFMAWYVSNILPGEYGTGKKPWFLFTPSYWSPKVITVSSDEESLLEFTDEDENESEIRLQKLTKVYPKSIFTCDKEDVTAVDNFSLSIKQGEVFALLGHNGAGKSTTIAMLTGLFPPTSGDAKIQGYSILQNMDEIRKTIGVCPQHDILFPLLTANEHLELFAALKGVSSSEISSSVEEILDKVGLDASEHLNKPTKSFSGGMKRKLSVAIALIGNSKVIFLDECTAGMDPLSRRKIWTLIQNCREGRTIILTTHFMEEADILGDRIAIMSKGTLKVLGTSVELKNSFGVGYYFVFVKKEGCDSSYISNLVSKHFDGKETLVSDERNEINFQIPTECLSKFSDFFEELDNSIEELQLHSYGIYTTTLEEVFLKIAEEEEELE